MARINAEQRDIEMLVSLGVELETAKQFRKFLAGEDNSNDQEISEIVAFISPLLRARFTLQEITAPGK